MKKIREWLNVQLVKNPGRMVLLSIFLFDILFFLLSAFVIRGLAADGNEKMTMFEAVFCTVTMILDAGCIQFVVPDVSTAGYAVVIICLIIVVIGMVSFTGAVIGYVTNYISGFIESANSGHRKLKLYDHIVILNWNTRASEIVNDLLYCSTRQKVVVLVSENKKEVIKEIDERLDDTVQKENGIVRKQCEGMSFFKRIIYMKKNSFKKNITVIVREGDIFSYKQLMDISLEKARTVIILGTDINNTICKFEHKEFLETRNKGNSQTVKTLMQVSDITAAQYSADNQKIIVEITDDWTADLVDKIIKYKQVDEKCHIVPVRVNQILGHILSQFSLMPELNLAYNELFSNRGAAFYTKEQTVADDDAYIRDYLPEHRHSLPLTSMKIDNKEYFYYAAASYRDIDRSSPVEPSSYEVSLKKNYWIEEKNVIILGHNSRYEDILKGFVSFRSEWGHRDPVTNEIDTSREIVRIVVVDDQKHLEKMDFSKYPFVIQTVAAEIYDRETICNTIKKFVSENEEDTSVLILSDDMALNEDIDADALANLVYVQDIINEKKAAEPDFDPESIDVIVEIIDPKHHDVINSYSVNNVVISNRYISKMITQIGEKEALFDFYADILTYDEDGSDSFDSKEIYTKKVSSYFEKLPGKTKADEFVRAVYDASVDTSLPKEKQTPAIVLGYVKPGGKMILFSGDLSEIDVEIEQKDKILVFTNH